MSELSKIEALFSRAWAEDRKSLSEAEVYSILELCGLGVPAYVVVPASAGDTMRHGVPVQFSAAAADVCSRIPGEKLVLKILSSATLHKTESGGVKVMEKASGPVGEALTAMAVKFPEAEGFLACEFVEHSAFALGEELLLGARSDDAYGPVITLGPGGTDAEALIKSLRPGTAPSVIPVEMAFNSGVWKQFLEQAWVWRYVSGCARGGRCLAQDGEMVKWLEGFAHLLKNFRDGGPSEWAIEEFEINPLAVSKGRLVALDGVLRFRKAKTDAARRKPSKKGVESLIHSRSLAVVGVSEKKMNMARIILNNVIKAGFPKEKAYIIKEGAAEIDGVKCYPSPADLPEKADMYVVAVPAPEVPKVLADAGSSGKVNGVVLISGGIGEKAGSEDIGRTVVDILNRAREKNPDFALSGGNSMGIVLNDARVNTFFIPGHKLEHPLGVNPHGARTAFVSQSGAFVISVISKMPWLKPAYSITVGNQQDVTVPDYVERLADEDDLKVLLVYIEGFKPGDGLALARVVEKARTKGKQVLLYKAGRTVVGQKAVMGHTASIAGDYMVTRAIMEKAGALVAESFDEFSDLAALAYCLAGRRPANGNTFFMSNAGFEAAGMADGISGPLAAGMSPELTAEMAGTLKEHKLDSIVDARNPLDVTPMATDAAIGAIVRTALASDEYSGALVSMIPLTVAMNTLPKSPDWPDDLDNSFLKGAAETARAEKKPLIFCAAAGARYEPYCAYAQSLGLPVFRSADRAAAMYGRYLEYVLKDRGPGLF
ncbi:MAG: putative ADP Acetyl CoA Synthethase [Elusimicrobia bacterium]|nr:MAG: putative ADP Acetyl CoA Synthethase [Elusimicrobiota bacterium]KAF0154944.1 MAG: putative ADP Acetyl CoA Synthethase [Elusimicrobiota bacterium]